MAFDKLLTNFLLSEKDQIQMLHQIPFIDDKSLWLRDYY
jgi:hypothetical protein